MAFSATSQIHQIPASWSTSSVRERSKKRQTHSQFSLFTCGKVMKSLKIECGVQVKNKLVEWKKNAHSKTFKMYFKSFLNFVFASGSTSISIRTEHWKAIFLAISTIHNISRFTLVWKLLMFRGGKNNDGQRVCFRTYLYVYHIDFAGAKNSICLCVKFFFIKM